MKVAVIITVSFKIAVMLIVSRYGFHGNYGYSDSFSLKGER